jgi:hypothetical protein
MICLFGLALIALPAMADDTPPATRTLDEINIEGAVDVPQVLFITSRDNVRFDDDMGWLFLPSAEEILANTILPSEITSQKFPEFEVPDLNNQGEPAAAPDAKE